jgi:hypothetical protein
MIRCKARKIRWSARGRKVSVDVLLFGVVPSRIRDRIGEILVMLQSEDLKAGGRCVVNRGKEREAERRILNLSS